MEFCGTIKHWNTERGFGFIRRHDGAPDVFVHISSFRLDGELKSPEPKIGDRVIFGIEQSQRNGGKLQAVGVYFEGVTDG